MSPRVHASVRRAGANGFGMFRLSRTCSVRRWPFWLLLAAWFCANSPQAATYEIVLWLGNARHFSHQQRLSAEVAFVLAGEPAAAVVAVAKAPSEKPFAPSVPTEATLKKIELAVQETSELLPPALRALVRTESAPLLPDALRAAPPSEPPRAV